MKLLLVSLTILGLLLNPLTPAYAEATAGKPALAQRSIQEVPLSTRCKVSTTPPQALVQRYFSTPATSGLYRISMHKGATPLGSTMLRVQGTAPAKAASRKAIYAGIQAVSQGLQQFPFAALDQGLQAAVRLWSQPSLLAHSMPLESLFTLRNAPAGNMLFKPATSMPLNPDEIDKTIRELEQQIDALKNKTTPEAKKQRNALKTEAELWHIIRDAVIGMNPDICTFKGHTTYKEIKKLVADKIIIALNTRIGEAMDDPYHEDTNTFTSGKTAKQLGHEAQSTTKKGFKDGLVVGYYADLIQAFTTFPEHCEKGIWDILMQPTDFLFVTKARVLQALAEDKDMWEFIVMLDHLLQKTKQLLQNPAQKLKTALDKKKREFEKLKKDIEKAKKELEDATLAPQKNKDQGEAEKSKALEKKTIDDLLVFLSCHDAMKVVVICDVKTLIRNDLLAALIVQAKEKLGQGDAADNVEKLLTTASTTLTPDNAALNQLVLAAQHAARIEAAKTGKDATFLQAIYEAEIRILVQGLAGLQRYSKECDPDKLKLNLAAMFDQILEDFMNDVKSNDKTLDVIKRVQSEGARIAMKTGVNVALGANKNFKKIRNLLVAIDNLITWLKTEVTRADPESLKSIWITSITEINTLYGEIKNMLQDIKDLIEILDDPTREPTPVKGGILQ